MLLNTTVRGVDSWLLINGIGTAHLWKIRCMAVEGFLPVECAGSLVARLLAIKQLSELKLPWQYLPWHQLTINSTSTEISTYHNLPYNFHIFPHISTSCSACRGHPTLSQSAMSLLSFLANSWIILKILCSRSAVGSSTWEYLRFEDRTAENFQPITWRMTSGFTG